MKKREYEIPVQFIKIDLHIFKFDPLKGGTYVELPKSIAATKGVVNVKYTDNFCSLYSILALKHRADVHPERVKQYKQYLNELIYDETEFPMKIHIYDTLKKRMT